MMIVKWRKRYWGEVTVKWVCRATSRLCHLYFVANLSPFYTDKMTFSNKKKVKEYQDLFLVKSTRAPFEYSWRGVNILRVLEEVSMFFLQTFDRSHLCCLREVEMAAMTRYLLICI